MRLPRWAFNVLDRLVTVERHRRELEIKRRIRAQDKTLRVWADRKSMEHDMGTCGGEAGGCRFFPCVPAA